MEVRRVLGTAEWLESARPLLMSDEARHNSLLGRASTHMRDPGRYKGFALWLAEDAGAVTAAAMQLETSTPLTVAKPVKDGAIEALAIGIAEAGVKLPGVTGGVPEAENFAGAWCTRTGQSQRVRLTSATYQVTRVRDVPPAPGNARTALPEDRDLLVQWFVAFDEDADPDGPDEAAGRIWVERGIATGDDPGIWLWEDGGRPVSFTAFHDPTPTGVHVGPVYTPSEYRGRGYATSLVAAMSTWVLDNGRERCFLYADRENPTSNGIYLRIGYEHACDGVDIAFS
jgi:hypothetical protein